MESPLVSHPTAARLPFRFVQTWLGHRSRFCAFGGSKSNLSCQIWLFFVLVVQWDVNKGRTRLTADKGVHSGPPNATSCFRKLSKWMSHSGKCLIQGNISHSAKSHSICSKCITRTQPATSARGFHPLRRAKKGRLRFPAFSSKRELPHPSRQFDRIFLWKRPHMSSSSLSSTIRVYLAAEFHLGGGHMVG